MMGVTRGLNSKPEIVSLKIDADQAPYVLTKPIHCSQKLLDRFSDGSITIQLNVIHNLELERHLLGFGHHIEVLDPSGLRYCIARNLQMGAELYKD